MSSYPPHEQRAFDFDGKLLWSKGNQSDDIPDLITSLLDGVVKVERASDEHDRNGIDWWVTLRGGAQIGIDEKTREPGCAKYWDRLDLFGEEGVELSPEIWSAMPKGEPTSREWSDKWFNSYPATGWTLDERKATDYVLCTFNPQDSSTVALLPFQQYRTAFRRYLPTWRQEFKVAEQPNESHGGRWLSQCVFVPLWCVLDALREISTGIREK